MAVSTHRRRISKFQSTPSARRATYTTQDRRRRIRFQSTPSARRATGGPGPARPSESISIHALREEGDSCQQIFPVTNF